MSKGDSNFAYTKCNMCKEQLSHIINLSFEIMNANMLKDKVALTAPSVKKIVHVYRQYCQERKSRNCIQLKY